MGFVLVFRRYAPFNQFGLGFEGDHRTGPSISMNATARTVGVVPFDRGNVGSIGAASSGTEFTGGGDWLRRVLGRHHSKVACSVSNRVVSQSSIGFSASTAGANPMVPVVAPAIDTDVDLRADWAGNGLHLQGVVRGDNFPNAEVFVLDARATGCLLFDGRTTGGRETGPMTRLAGSHATQRLGAFSVTLPLSRDSLFPAARTSCPVTTMR